MKIIASLVKTSPAFISEVFIVRLLYLSANLRMHTVIRTTNMFANDNSSFQARFSSDERESEGTLTIHVSEYTEELEAAFVPDDMSLFPKASSDGRTLWFAADNLEETLEMLGYSADDTFEKEETVRVKLRTDRIYINNLPLDDVNNLIRVLDIEKI